jgi:putative endopeptidase
MNRSLLAAALAASLSLAANAALDVAELDTGASPCTDFYRYVNGRWLESALIPNDRSSWGTFSIVDKGNEAVLLQALAEAMKSPPPIGSDARKAVDYFGSGMDIEAIETAGLEPVRGQLARAEAVDSVESLAQALGAFHAQRIRAGFQFTVRPDAKDSSRYLAQLVQGGLGLPDRDYYFRDDAKSREQREAYVRHVARVFQLAGESSLDAQSHAQVVLALETKLAGASMTNVERRDPERTYNPMPVAKLQALAKGFPWPTYLASLGAAEVDEVNVAQPAFFEAFARLARERDPSEWRTYLRWHVLHATAAVLPRAFVDADFDFYQRELRGRRAFPERNGHVLEVVSGHYGEEPMAQAVAQLFVARAFPPAAKGRAQQLVRNVKEALATRLRSVEWMSDATRERALEKLAAMRTKIGYPDHWREYADAKVGRQPFATNWLRANEYEMRRLIGHLGKPVDRDEWWMAPHIVNAYYSSELNEIVFPAGILQPPFFDATADDALNYGAIGSVIGHEITHGFDDRGRRFDARGNLRDWWTEKDANGYLTRAKRLEDHYAGFEGVDGIHVNGKLTLGENIADVGGLKIAYLALQHALEGTGRKPIDGLAPEQRFFIAFAQVWRMAYRPAYERLMLQTDQHSPAQFRVRGALAHMPEFARTFSCEPAKTLAAQPADIW